MTGNLIRVVATVYGIPSVGVSPRLIGLAKIYKVAERLEAALDTAVIRRVL